MKGESNATAPNWFSCSRAEAQGTCAALSLLPRSRSCCGQPAWHSEQLHATHPGFAQTNEPAQTADEHPVYNSDSGGQKDLLEHDLLRAAFSGPRLYCGTNHSLLPCSAEDPR